MSKRASRNRRRLQRGLKEKSESLQRETLPPGAQTQRYAEILGADGPICYACEQRVIPEDDDACVCIECGGRNRRLYRSESVTEVMARVTAQTVARIRACFAKPMV